MDTFAWVGVISLKLTCVHGHITPTVRGHLENAGQIIRLIVNKFQRMCGYMGKSQLLCNCVNNTEI